MIERLIFKIYLSLRPTVKVGLSILVLAVIWLKRKAVLPRQNPRIVKGNKTKGMFGSPYDIVVLYYFSILIDAWRSAQ